MIKKIMSPNFLLGYLLGVTTAAACTVLAAQVVGSGYLYGWDVQFRGETICSSPYVWTGIREIECD